MMVHVDGSASGVQPYLVSHLCPVDVCLSIQQMRDELNMNVVDFQTVYLSCLFLQSSWSKALFCRLWRIVGWRRWRASHFAGRDRCGPLI